MRISREIQEQRDQCDGITMREGEEARDGRLAGISCSALQVMASGLGAVGEHGEALSREAE